MAAPSGFTYQTRKNGEVVIHHHGRYATVLRGRRAESFLARVVQDDEQELMARVTGNYKRGNERSSATSQERELSPRVRRVVHMPRAIWKGAINFGLVTIPVGMYTATDNKSPSFKQLRKSDHSPIRYKRVAEADGEEVQWDDIVKGYEFEKDRFVVFTDEDLEAAVPEGNKLVDVVQFVDEDEIDPMMYKKAYYLAPEKTGIKAYRILQEALDAKGRVGIAKVSIREKQQLATLRTKDGVIVMETMYWPDEIRAGEFEELDANIEIRPEEVEMAATIIDNLTKPFDESAYEDKSRGVIEEIAAKKIAGEEIVAPASPEPTKVVDLLEALKASVEATKEKQAKAG